MTHLVFRKYALDEAGSAALLFADTDELCGIYILGFANGAKYVGQTVHIIHRIAQHRRRFDDITDVSFAPCPQADLDLQERETIREMQKSHELRNLLLMHLPGGSGDFSLTIEEHAAISLPSTRMTRKRLTDEPPKLQKKFWKLYNHAQYSRLRKVMGEYVDATIADPLGTQYFLWTISALPSTARTRDQQRLAALSCGNLEALVMYEWKDEEGPFWGGFLNIAGEDLTEDQLTELVDDPRIEAYDGDYRQRSDVITLEFDELETLSALLAIPFVVDAAYKLNTGLMRQGSTMYRRFHNVHLANDILNHRAASLIHP